MTDSRHRRPSRRAPIDPAKLKAARKAAGLSQTELADRLGVVHSAISQVETGKHSFSPETYAKLVTVLGEAGVWRDLLTDQTPETP